MPRQHFNIDFYGVQPPAVLLAALSGGADSVALTHYAQQLGFHLYAAHLNHGLRGEESERDEQFVRNFCKERQIPLFVEWEDVSEIAKQKNMGVEECGRQLRYDFLQRCAAGLSAELGEPVWIITAHTLSDNAETLLLNLTRGAGLNGLGGIPPRRANILRPMLAVTRKTVEDYCELMQLEYVTDSSNEEDQYTRNRMRHTVVPLLEEINPSFQEAVGNTMRSLREDEQLLSVLAREAYVKAKQGIGFSLEVLQNTPEALRSRVLLRICAEASIPANAKLVWQLFQLIESKTGRLEGANGKFFSASRGMLTVRDTKAWRATAVSKKASIPLPEQGEFLSATGKPYKIQTFDTTTSETFHKIYKNDFDIWMDCGRICGSVLRRTRKPNDSIKLCGNRPTKTLKKLFTELQVPVGERAKRFVLVDDNGVIAVEGVGVDARVACTQETVKILQVTLVHDET